MTVRMVRILFLFTGVVGGCAGETPTDGDADADTDADVDAWEVNPPTEPAAPALPVPPDLPRLRSWDCPEGWPAVQHESVTDETGDRFSWCEPPPLPRLRVPGRHNVLNALAAIAVATELGVTDDSIRQALAGFQGIGRRFQVAGEINTVAGSVLLIDDYAHHPREIAPMLAAVRAGWPKRRLVVVFQPHRYSRTHDLLDDFIQVLSGADVLVLCEVYAAGEPPVTGADGRALARGIRARGHVDPVFVEDLAELPAVLNDLLQDGDVLLTLGAGDIGAASARLLTELSGGTR